MAVQVLDARTPGELPRYVSGPKRGQLRAYEQPRDLAWIDAIGLHHLGPCLPLVKPGQPPAERALWRAKRQPYHVLVLPDVVVVAWDFRVVTWHGNSLNRRSVGVALAGNFPSLESKREPHHDDPRDFAEALAAALAFVRGELPHVDRLLTHSQTSRKPADPGELAARLATAAGAALTPPLRPRPDFHVGTGQPWPAAWRVPLTKG